MFEHVGSPITTPISARCAASDEDGVALMHIDRPRDGPAATNPWMQIYFSRRLSSGALGMAPPIEQSGPLTDSRVLRLHYARNAEGLARALPCPSRRGQGDLRRALLPHVGVLSGRLRGRVPLRGPCRVPVPAGEKTGRPAPDARYIARAEAALRRREAASTCRKPADRRIITFGEAR